MKKINEMLIVRNGERDGSLRVDAFAYEEGYSVEFRLWSDPTYGITVEDATTLRDRLTAALDAIAAHRAAADHGPDVEERQNGEGT